MNDFSEGDMAYELAEREILNMPVYWAMQQYPDLPLDKPLEQCEADIHLEWLQLATDHPDRIHEVYFNMIGEYT